jgi:DNA repair protein RAD7
VAKFIDEVEAFGDLSTRDMDRICQIISRNRSLNNNTLRLFMEPQGEKLTLYDCASKYQRLRLLLVLIFSRN